MVQRCIADVVGFVSEWFMGTSVLESMTLGDLATKSIEALGLRLNLVVVLLAVLSPSFSGVTLPSRYPRQRCRMPLG